MLQISFIRQNKELVKERLSVKYFGDLWLVDNVVELDEQVRKLKVESETLQADLNAASKAIGLLLGKGQPEDAEQKKQEITQHKSSMQQLNNQLAVAEIPDSSDYRKNLYRRFLYRANALYRLRLAFQPHVQLIVAQAG